MTNCPFCTNENKTTILRYDPKKPPEKKNHMMGKYLCERHGSLMWDSKKKQFNLAT
jgi:Fe-S oxidoreductase